MATVCEGRWADATACGECAKCKATARQAVHKIRQQRAEIAGLRETGYRLLDTCHDLRDRREESDAVAEARVARLARAVRDLLGSADAMWEEKRQGHDWAEACEAARKVMAEEKAAAGPVASLEASGAAEATDGPD